MLGSPVKSKILMERAELSDKLVDMESQPHQHALESPLLVSSLEAFYAASCKGTGQRKELNADFLAILVLFPSIYWPGERARGEILFLGI